MSDEFTQRWAITICIRRPDEDKEVLMKKKFCLQILGAE